MKTRNDFVSNSSSCSFIIKDPLAFKKAAFSWSKDCVDSLSGLNAFAICRYEDKDLFPKSLTYDGWEYDGKFRFTIFIGDLMSIDENLLSKLEEVELMCDDSDTQNMFMLSVMKKALENKGISVDSSCSEHPLMFEDDDDYGEDKFMRNMCADAFSALSAKKDDDLIADSSNFNIDGVFGI